MTGDFPYSTSFRQAKYFHNGRRRKVRLIVLHSAETPEKITTAEGVQNYFRDPDARASAHMTFDSDSCAQSVLLKDTAFGAGNANADGIHVEHAGRASQTAAQWLDPYSVAMLKRSAVGVAELIQKFDVDFQFLNARALKTAKSGITTHAEVSKAWPSNGHSDPGLHYPLGQYMGWVGDALTGRLTMRIVNGKLVLGTDAAPVVSGASTKMKWERVLRFTRPPMTGEDVVAVQRAVNVTQTGIYDNATAAAVASWQQRTMGTPHSDRNSGLVGLFTAKRMGIAE